MNKKDNIGKNTQQKAISRKIHKRNEDAAFNDTTLGKHFETARHIKHHKHQKPNSKDVDQILSVLEVVNKEAIKSGLGGGLHGPADKMLNGIHMLRSNKTLGPLSFLNDPGRMKQ